MANHSIVRSSTATASLLDHRRRLPRTTRYSVSLGQAPLIRSRTRDITSSTREKPVNSNRQPQRSHLAATGGGTITLTGDTCIAKQQCRQRVKPVCTRYQVERTDSLAGYSTFRISIIVTAVSAENRDTAETILQTSRPPPPTTHWTISASEEKLARENLSLTMSSMAPPPLPSSNGIAVAPSGVVGAPSSGASVNGHANSSVAVANDASTDGQVVPSVPEITAVQGIVPTLQ